MTYKIHIDTSSETPLYQQIVDSIERQIISGSLQSGDYLVSVRDMAVQTQINPNTVAKAYKTLQNLNLVESVRGKGLKVKNLNKQKSENRKNTLVKQKVQELLKVAKNLNLTEKELFEMIKEENKNGK